MEDHRPDAVEGSDPDWFRYSVEIFLPYTDDTGQPIEEEVFDAWANEVAARIGGLTVISGFSKGYSREDNRTLDERGRSIRLSAHSQEELDELILFTGRTFRQHSIYAQTMPPARIVRIPPEAVDTPPSMPAAKEPTV